MAVNAAATASLAFVTSSVGAAPWLASCKGVRASCLRANVTHEAYKLIVELLKGILDLLVDGGEDVLGLLKRLTLGGEKKSVISTGWGVALRSYLLLQHVLGILVTRSFLEFLDARLLLLEFLVVASLLLDEAVDGGGGDGELGWGSHFQCCSEDA